MGKQAVEWWLGPGVVLSWLFLIACFSVLVWAVLGNVGGSVGRNIMAWGASAGLFVVVACWVGVAWAVDGEG